MKPATDYSLNQLAAVLSALDGERRNPNTKRNAIAAIGRSAKPLDLTPEQVLAAADGLFDGRMDAEAFRRMLADGGPEDAPAETAEPQQDDEAGSAETPGPKPREGTKQALMIEMLRRPEGATIAQIAAATGWQHHTCRGVIAGALKKKLGLSITSEKTEGAVRVYRVAE